MINIKKEDIEKSNSWPIVEAKKILKERKKFIDKKGKITLQTGYGPSGFCLLYTSPSPRDCQ